MSGEARAQDLCRIISAEPFISDVIIIMRVLSLNSVKESTKCVAETERDKER